MRNRNLKIMFIGAAMMLANHHALHAADMGVAEVVAPPNAENIIVAEALEKILESAKDLLSDDEKSKIYEMITALTYSNVALVVTEEEYQRINDNYLRILESEDFAQEYLSCFCPYLDEDDNLRIQLKKSWYEYADDLRKLNLFLDTKVYPCFAVVMYEVMSIYLLKKHWENGESGSETIANMITAPICYYKLFKPQDGIDRLVGIIGLGTLMPKERLLSIFDAQTIKTVAGLYYDVLGNVANALYNYCFGDA